MMVARADIKYIFEKKAIKDSRILNGIARCRLRILTYTSIESSAKQVAVGSGIAVLACEIKLNVNNPDTVINKDINGVRLVLAIEYIAAPLTRLKTMEVSRAVSMLTPKRLKT